MVNDVAELARARRSGGQYRLKAAAVADHRQFRVTAVVGEYVGIEPDHAEAVLVDLLQPVAMATIEVRLPAEERARQMARALADDPADRRNRMNGPSYR